MKRRRVKSIKFIDLFCGIGSFTKSFSELGMECVFACDIDKSVRQNYKVNYGEDIFGDIRKVAVEDVPDYDILCAGFPCQAFSKIGYGKGSKDPRARLFFQTLKFIDYHNPKFIIFENVKRLKTYSVFQNILISLMQRDYSVEWRVLTASDYGLPQKRERIFIVGKRNDLKCAKTCFFDTLSSFERTDVTLSTFFKKDFERKYSKTVRCGGLCGRIDSGHDWRKYWVRENGCRAVYTLQMHDVIRLQGFDKFNFVGFNRDIWKMLGNTIPTILTSILGQRVLNLLQKERVEPHVSFSADKSTQTSYCTGDVPCS